MKIYQIDSSARKEGSSSRALAKKLLDKIKKPEDEVIYRDLDDEMVFVSGLTESGMKIDKKDQTEHHKKMFELSDTLVRELKESDIIIISAPIYNYGPPATLKAWSDLAARVGETFRFKPNGRREGLLKNQFKDAINILDRIIKKYPEFLPALNNIALNYVNIKNFIEAEKYYSICLNLKPEELIFINNLAKVFHDTNQYKKALPLLQKSLMKNKEQLDIIKITAKCLFELDLTKDLDIFLSKVLKKYSDDITLKYYYGKNLLKINKHIEGLNMLKKTLGVIEFDKKKFKII